MVHSSSVTPDSRHLHSPETICEAITSAVATAEECSAVELDPLYETVDVSALGALFASTNRETERSGTVRFCYHGYEVTVSVTDERVTVTLGEPSEHSG